MPAPRASPARLPNKPPRAMPPTFDISVLGVSLSMKHELRVMQAQGSGSIVNLSSTMGHRGAPGASLYTASKHAVEGLAKSAALEGAAFGVRVNAMTPGPVETEMLSRFTGNAEARPAWSPALRSSVWAGRRKSPTPSSSRRRTGRRSSPHRSSPSTAVGQLRRTCIAGKQDRKASLTAVGSDADPINSYVEGARIS
jgi:NAD(P)-dependent dehydrogenase (short-subunit alcohol dehydrogenase family)